MTYLNYKENTLFLENTPLLTLVKKFGTPTYVYSETCLQDAYSAFKTAFENIDHMVCYAVKANANLSILKLLSDWGSGFDIVSGGELERLIQIQTRKEQIIFSGVGKQIDEIITAINYGIYCFNIESSAELMRIANIAQQRKKVVNIALRINPNIAINTHAYITTGHKDNKFGIPKSEVLQICQSIKQLKYINLIGIGCHIGSQITASLPFEQLLDFLLKTAETLKNQGFKLKTLNIGGGLGICYQHESVISISEYGKLITQKLKSSDLKLIIEPGRSLIGHAGILLTQIEYLKTTPDKNFVITNAGMNDLIRPALYDAWHNIMPILLRHEDKILYDIVGPICESSDNLGLNRLLAVKEQDYLVICEAGAYGFSMSSNYNSRKRAAEILVKNDYYQLIRKRETAEDLFAAELSAANKLN